MEMEKNNVDVIFSEGSVRATWNPEMTMCPRTHVHFPIVYQYTAKRSGSSWTWVAHALGRSKAIIARGKAKNRNDAMQSAHDAVIAETKQPTAATSDAA